MFNMIGRRSLTKAVLVSACAWCMPAGGASAGVLDWIGLGGDKSPQAASLNYLREHLGKFGLLPVLVPNEQMPGDVISTDNWAGIYARAGECFGQIALTRNSGGQFLSDTVLEITQKDTLAVGVEQLAKLQLANSAVRTATVTYRDIEVISASTVNLRGAFKVDEPACAAIGDSVSERVTEPPADGRLLLVVGSVVKARRTATFVFGDDVAVSLEAEDIGKLIQDGARELGVNIGKPEVKFAISGDTKRLERISYTYQAPLVVAYAPAFLPSLIREEVAGDGSSSDQLEGVAWAAIDAGDLSNAAARNQVVEALNAALQYSAGRE